ncbi:hypothetical protein HDU78_010840 [Chytriomyces hyalinus]|nr:hypothetical protein HDU78_010840 [Chytriomyces hyalinus]
MQEHRRRLSFMILKNDQEGEDEVYQVSSNVPPVPTDSTSANTFKSAARAANVPKASIQNLEQSCDDDAGDVNSDGKVLQPNSPKPALVPHFPAFSSIPPSNNGSSTSFLNNVVRSFNSVQSDVTEDGIIFGISRRVEETKENLMASRIYQLALWAWESTTFNIYFYTLCHVGILMTVVLVLKFGIGMHAPNIVHYNFVHAAAGFLGKISFAFGLRATQLISKEFMARNLVKRGKGVSLSSIAHPVPLLKLNSDEGKTLRYLFLLALALVEINIWYLGIAMEWIPSVSEFGTYPCTQIRYMKEPKLPSDLGNYLQGNSDLSMIYSYGLPLGDGLVGGLSAWPLTVPANSFNIDLPGTAYAINSVCGDLRVAKNGTENGLTQFRILQTEVWNTMFSANILVQMPGGSHDWEEHLDQDIVQECMVRYVMGDAEVAFGFVSDEWGGLVASNLHSIHLESGLSIERGQSSRIYFGRVHDAFRHNSKNENITRWVIDATNVVLNGTSYGASQGALFANLFQWATLPDGYYHTSITWKGMAAIMAMIARYVLLQYDDSSIDECAYTGMNGAGDVHAPDYIVTLAIVAVILCVIAELCQLFWWFLLSGGGEKQDRAARMLESPMQMLYDMRAGATGILGELPSDGDQSLAAVKRHFDDVDVRFGESRQTRANAVGMLILGLPGEVVAMYDKREYI